MAEIEQLESILSDMDPAARAEALAALAAEGAIERPAEMAVANMHCHTFFSFNAYGYSPSALAWLAWKRNYRLMGTVDFDVLDGVDEFLGACELLGVRGSAGIETRVFVPEFAAYEINSPGEPGITYHMGIGFGSSAVPAVVAPLLAELGERAWRRNLDVLQRVNDYLDPVRVDYEREVLPLTPAGNATERHMVVAYLRAAERQVRDPAGFWAAKLGRPRGEVEALLADSPRMQNEVRARLMKRGGVGYVQPSTESFPTVDEFHRLVLACGALPCITWLDGTSAGEQAMDELIVLLVGQGAVALNIVPDRNWNVADPALRKVKVRNLYRVVELAQEWDLPLNVGTEMNSFGQKRVDDFDSPALAPMAQAFLDGAHFVYGHTLLQRARGLGYQSEWARGQMPERRDRNAFYRQVGELVPPGRAGLERLVAVDPARTPAENLEILSE